MVQLQNDRRDGVMERFRCDSSGRIQGLLIRELYKCTKKYVPPFVLFLSILISEMMVFGLFFYQTVEMQIMYF